MFLVHVFNIVCAVLLSDARAQVLIEDGGMSSSTQVVYESHTQEMRDAYHLRSVRRVGVGVTASGPAGMAGVQMELNFTPEYSFVGGFGFGSDYQAFHLQVKRALAGRWFMPYVAGGYARWYTVGQRQGQVGDTTPTFLSRRFLSDRERQQGTFSENLVFPTAGIQYLQLMGDWVGASVYAEVSMLIDLDDLVAEPTGGLGFMYYF